MLTPPTMPRESRVRNPSRLHLPELGGPGAALLLPEEEAHYVARVCRLRVGDHMTATDGRGGA